MGIPIQTLVQQLTTVELVLLQRVNVQTKPSATLLLSVQEVLNYVSRLKFFIFYWNLHYLSIPSIFTSK